MRKLEMLICRLILVALASSCTLSDNEGTHATSAEEAFDLLNTEGMTCRAMEMVISLGDKEKEALGLLVRASFDPDSIGRMIATRARDCEGHKIPSGPKMDTQGITASYQVEFIEEKSGSGGNPSTATYVDSASFNWMCNSGTPAPWYNPADYIARYHVNGAYANRSRLSVRGSNINSYCYIHDSHAARVYTDDDILMCIGYWSVNLCAAILPLPGETFVWLL